MRCCILFLVLPVIARASEQPLCEDDTCSASKSSVLLQINQKTSDAGFAMIEEEESTEDDASDEPEQDEETPEPEQEDEPPEPAQDDASKESGLMEIDSADGKHAQQKGTESWSCRRRRSRRRAGASGTCADSRSACPAWVDRGYCASDSRYNRFMTRNCQESCGLCRAAANPTAAPTPPPTPVPTTPQPPTSDASAGCADKKDSCGSWARAGYCTEKYVEYMKDNCPKSCNHCGGSSGSSDGGSGSSGSSGGGDDSSGSSGGGDDSSGSSGGDGDSSGSSGGGEDTASTPAPSSSSGSTSCPACSGVKTQMSSDELSKMLELHNKMRRTVGTSAVKWNCQLMCQAQEWADGCKTSNVHSDSYNFPIPAGENWAGGSDVEQAAWMWFSESGLAPQSRSPSDSRDGGVIGHYTAMVWDSADDLGCGICRTGKYGGGIWCQYSGSPAPNMGGRYEANIPPFDGSLSKYTNAGISESEVRKWYDKFASWGNSVSDGANGALSRLR